MTATPDRPRPRTPDRANDDGAMLVWHGYLLGGTGSNIYTRNVVSEWVEEGREVILMCQEPDPSVLACVHEVLDVDGEQVAAREEIVPGGAAARREQGLGSCTMVRSDLAGVLPVYVLDRYAGWDVVRFTEMHDAALELWAERYRAALRGVLARTRVRGALLNHAVMGPPVLREMFDQAGVPYAVKVHGSELEYAIAEEPDRFAPPALAGLLGARSVLVGSGHIAARTLELLRPHGTTRELAHVEALMAEIPPGVDLELFAPATDVPAARERLLGELRSRAQRSAGRDEHAVTAFEQVLAAGPAPTLAQRLHALHGTWEERHVDVDAEQAVAALLPAGADVRASTVTFVGKFIRQKGVHLLLAALPLVRARVPDLRVLMAGFGPMREGLEAMVTALDTADLQLLRALAEYGGALDGGPPGALPHLVEFLDELERDGNVAAYLAAARGLRSRVAFTGLVDHDVLAALWPLCRASVVPSILPEAFGMVSAEAAACGCTPVVSRHSGLATVAEQLELRSPAHLARLMSFDVHGASPVRDLAERITALCQLAPEDAVSLAEAGRRTVVEEWGWTAIADRVAEACAAPVGAPSLPA
jgi:glycosyltransferase involved in cell wall biosynthesis